MSEAYASMYENRFAAHGGKDTDAGARYAKPFKGGDKKGVYTMKGKDGKPLFDKKEEFETEEELIEAKKDACYHKVKSRYDVWPSAYASGALVKCRQKGAKNWGNSSKKEEVEYSTEGYKAMDPKRAENQAKGKSRDGDGPEQARKIRLASTAHNDPKVGGMARAAVKDQEERNKKLGKDKRSLEKAYKSPSYKKEELEAVFAVLIGEGVAESEESAIHIINHMSDEWYESIVDSILSEGLEKFKKAQAERRKARMNPDEEKIELKPEPNKPVYNAEPKTVKKLRPSGPRKR